MIEAILCIIILIVTIDLVIENAGVTGATYERDDLKTDPPTQRVTND